MPNLRRSARLNPSAEGSLTIPEAQAHTPEPAKTSSTSGGAKLFFGPNPSWPEGNEGLTTFVEGADLSPTRAEALGPATAPVLGGGDASGPVTGPSLEGSKASGHAKEWDTWEVAGQTATQDPKDPRAGDPPSSDNSDDESESGQSKMGDDSSRRCRIRRPLHSCPEAFTVCGKELEESASAGKGKGKRNRNKGKSDMRARRGLGKPRDLVHPEDRPELRVVVDRVFATSPDYTKYITMIWILTLENLPEPYRSYNFFPSRTRLAILKQFLQRYSWGAGEDIGHCLDVF